MACYSPLIGYYSAERTKSGKRGIVFSPPLSFSGLPLKLPCGQCVGCRLEKSRQWAVRCLHENKMHETSCFVTLTYSDDYLPDGGTLVKRDLQLFMKRLRKSRHEKVRFYACGEYGETTFRPHYHLLLFGIDFPDKRLCKRDARGLEYFSSAELGEVWPYGRNVIGAVTFESAAYVARYVMKKVTGDAAEYHYGGREPEFVLMSRRPGIGATWLERNGAEVYKHDSVIVRGVEARPPRYYDKKYELVDAVGMQEIVKERRANSIGRHAENQLDRRRVRERVCHAKLGLYKRDVEK